jgi:hypothetical protein
MAVPTYNSSTQEAEAEDDKLEANMGGIRNPLKKKNDEKT